MNVDVPSKKLPILTCHITRKVEQPQKVLSLKRHMAFKEIEQSKNSTYNDVWDITSLIELVNRWKMNESKNCC